jgi:hypothetical protein
VHLSREKGDWIWTMSFAYCVWHIDCHGARDTHAPTLWARGSWFCVFRMSGGVLATLSLAAWSCIVLHCGVGGWERRGTLDRRTEREKERGRSVYCTIMIGTWRAVSRNGAVLGAAPPV